jgi:hypothetical protein
LPFLRRVADARADFSLAAANAGTSGWSMPAGITEGVDVVFRSTAMVNSPDG